MKVIVAVARKLLVAVWHVLHDKTDYVDFKPDREESANNGWPWYTFHDKAIIFVMGLDLVCKLT